MAFKILRKRFKAKKNVAAKEAKNTGETRRIWTGVSHGLHTAEEDSKIDGSVHAQREQVEGLEFWLFGAYDKQLAPGINEYLESNLFNNNLNEHQIRRRAKETMKKAYLSTMANTQDSENTNDVRGFATVIAINGERFVAASLGGYRAVLCRNGMATQLGIERSRKTKRKWSVSDLWNMQCTTSIKNEENPHKSAKLVFAAQKVEPETEFVILASDGIWQVMRNQEAVDLIAHIEDAQKAAECLAEEALNRFTKSTIACAVIRFH